MDAFLEATIASEAFRAGATFAVLFSALSLVGIYLLNKRFGWWVSADLLTVHKERADEARADADDAKAKAHGDADAKVVSMRDAMERRILELREDGAARVSQVRSDSQAEMDRLIKFTDALQRDVESWKLAWNMADQANREEADARWDEIRAFMARSVAQSAVIARFITELQRQAGVPPVRELEAGDDGGAEADVI